MIKLHKLPKLLKKRKRVGRGGKLGQTSTRGKGGQKSRTGDSRVRLGFEGGQMPLYRRLPKRGFNNALFKQEVIGINISRLNDAFDAGEQVTKETLISKGLVKERKGSFALIKILGTGELKKKLNVHADAFSKSALAAIKAQGGKAILNEEKINRGAAE